MPGDKPWRPPNIRRNIGVQHRPDDVSRVPPKKPTGFTTPTITTQGQIIPGVDPEEYMSLQIARRVREFRQTMTNTNIQLDFDTTCIGLEILVNEHTPEVSVGVAFGGDLASVPTNANVLANTSEVKSGEARFFDVKTDKVALITTGTSVEVRMTVLLP